MNGTAEPSRFRHLLDDRVDEGVFRVDRAVYTDGAVFEAEIERIFEGGWVFLATRARWRSRATIGRRKSAGSRST